MPRGRADNDGLAGSSETAKACDRIPQGGSIRWAQAWLKLSPPAPYVQGQAQVRRGNCRGNISPSVYRRIFQVVKQNGPAPDGRMPRHRAGVEMIP